MTLRTRLALSPLFPSTLRGALLPIVALLVLAGMLGRTALATDFSNVGLGITETGATVNAIAAGASSGQLYVGGSFMDVNGTDPASDVLANNIALWTGSTWSPLGQGLNGQVNAIVVIGRQVYVGGSFSMATNTDNTTVAVNNFALWNSLASRWNAVTVAGYPGGGVNGPVDSLTVVGGSIYIGGSFTSYVGTTNGFGTNLGNLLQYNPTTATYSTVAPGTNGPVLCGAGFGTTLLSGGSFTTPTSQLVTSSGGVFVTPAIANFGSTVTAVAYDSTGNAYIGGSFANLANGTAVNSIAVNLAGATGTTSYSAVGGGVLTAASAPGSVNAIFFDPANTTEPIVGGLFASAGGVTVGNLAQWNPNSATWSEYTGTTNGAVNTFGADSYGAIYVGGSFTTATSTGASITSAFVRIGANRAPTTGTASSSATGTATTSGTGSTSGSGSGTATTSGTTTAAGNVAVPGSGASSNSCGLGSSTGVLLIMAMLLLWKRPRSA